MLELRPNCEHCGKDLPNTSTEAMICSFECTYCAACAMEVFENVCPSCGGNFVARPIRPSEPAVKYPPSNKRVYQPKDLNSVRERQERLKEIAPEKR